MTGDAVRQLLTEISERAEKATAGPWEVDRNLPFSAEIVGVFAPGVKRYVVQQDVDGDWDDDAEEPEGGLLAADAAFISRSRIDVPRLVAALTAVLDLHKPEPSHTVAVVDDAEFGPNGELRGERREIEPDSFEEIVSREDNCMACAGYPVWPCVTYRAVAAALEEQP